jgi:hypothetical protein
MVVSKKRYFEKQGGRNMHAPHAEGICTTMSDIEG